MVEPQLQVFRGGWLAVGGGLAVTAASGQEALLRFAVESRKLAALPSVDRAAVEPLAPPVSHQLSAA